MTVIERFQYFQNILMFKCIHGMAPDYLCNNITMEIEVQTSLNTRSHDMNVYIPFQNSTRGQKSFYYSGAKNWNSLPNRTKDI